MESSEAGRAFVSLARRRQLEHLESSLARHEADMAGGRLGQEWVEASGISDLMPRLTAGSLTELWETIAGKLEELTARDADDPSAEHVVLLTAGLPLAPQDREGVDQQGREGADQQGREDADLHSREGGAHGEGTS